MDRRKPLSVNRLLFLLISAVPFVYQCCLVSVGIPGKSPSLFLWYETTFIHSKL